MGDDVLKIQQMAAFDLFCAKISVVECIWFDDDRFSPDDFDAAGTKAIDFSRVIRVELDRSDAQSS